jgi:ABC-type nitrate/sulfonate/bicarbonate transport system substrate-binding protein
MGHPVSKTFRAAALIGLLATCGALAGLSAARAETPLKVGVVSRTVFYLPAWTAIAQGFFKAEGLDVTIQVYDGSDKISDDLRSGADQIGMVPFEGLIAEAYKGGSLVAVAGNAQRLPHFIITQPEIKSLAGLKGKTIGVVSMNEGTTFFVNDMAKAGGFTLADVKVEAVGGSPTRQRLLKEKKIDAALQPYPLSYEAEEAGFTNLGPIGALVPEYLFTGTIVDRNWAKANHAALVGFLRALRRGTEYMFAHPDESAALGAKELRTSVPYAKRALEDTVKMKVMEADLSLPDASVRRVFDNVKAAKLIPADATLDRAKFIDESYLKESSR